MAARQPALIPTALTTLADVQTWVFGATPPATQPTNADALLIGLINRGSRTALDKMQRPSLLLRPISETRNGRGNNSILLQSTPLVGDLILLMVNGLVIPKRPPFGAAPQPVATFGGFAPNGWVCTNPWDGYGPPTSAVITLAGGVFTPGAGNVAIQYLSGAGNIGEAQTVPATAPYQVFPDCPQGPFTQDYQVTYLDGTVLTPVAQGTSPAQGQYLPPSGPSQPYTFAPADAGQGVLLSYSYIPLSISDAICRWVGESYKYRDRIGMKSQAVGGQETSSFNTVAMTQDVKDAIGPWTRTTPIQP